MNDLVDTTEMYLRTILELEEEGVPPLRALRDIGLGIIDRLPKLKTMFIGEAAGFIGALPKLLKGEAI